MMNLLRLADERLGNVSSNSVDTPTFNDCIIEYYHSAFTCN